MLRVPMINLPAINAINPKKIANWGRLGAVAGAAVLSLGSTGASADGTFVATASLEPIVPKSGSVDPIVVQRTVQEAPLAVAQTGGGGGGCGLGTIKQKESGGDYGAVSSSGKYRGAYQFDQGTWESTGGSGDPADASPSEQDKRAGMLYADRGSAPWNC